MGARMYVCVCARARVCAFASVCVCVSVYVCVCTYVRLHMRMCFYLLLFFFFFFFFFGLFLSFVSLLVVDVTESLPNRFGKSPYTIPEPSKASSPFTHSPGGSRCMR